MEGSVSLLLVTFVLLLLALVDVVMGKVFFFFSSSSLCFCFVFGFFNVRGLVGGGGGEMSGRGMQLPVQLKQFSRERLHSHAPAHAHRCTDTLCGSVVHSPLPSVVAN